jgi:hypothetical protein
VVNASENNSGLLGYKIRNKLFPGEDSYFKNNPNVTGMASESGDIILNPYSSKDINKNSVAKNEAFRLYLKDKNMTPDFEITKEQIEFFKNTPYEGNQKAIKETIAARIYADDPSAKATEEQRKWVRDNTQ